MYIMYVCMYVYTQIKCEINKILLNKFCFFSKCLNVFYLKTQNADEENDFFSGIFASKHVNMKRRNVPNMRQRYQILTVICDM